MIGAVILAAGASTRFGQPKQLHEVQGRTLMRRAVDCATEAGCRPVVVVLGANAERIRPALEGLDVQIVVNDAWREGVSSSVHAGIRALGASCPDVLGALLMVCDQPELTPDVLRGLIRRFDGQQERRVGCAYAGTVGVPALFGRVFFERLKSLEGDRGAKELLFDGEEILTIEWPDGAIDVDTPEADGSGTR